MCLSWLCSCTWNWDVDDDDDNAQDDRDDAEQASQSAEPPGPVDVPNLETVSGLETHKQHSVLAGRNTWKIMLFSQA